MTLATEPRVPLARARVVVAGLGVTGRAVVEALRGRVRSLVVVDAAAAEADLHDTAQVDLTATDLIVASPGWAPHTPLLTGAAAAGVPVWSEVELAWRLRRAGGAAWLAVTGTNGKTTTVGMLASILTAAGLRTAAVGNVGTPVVRAATDPGYDVLALELSSFQLHYTHTMAVQAGAILNVAPDHLDWHGGFDAYAADKARIYSGALVACVYPAGDERVRALVEGADVADGARAVGIAPGAPRPGELGVVDGILVDRAFHAPAQARDRQAYAAELATLDDLAHLSRPGEPVPGHIVTDALTAAALARAHGVPATAVAEGLRSFELGGHRIEPIVVRDAVTYVDDSKATNAHAAAASLGAFGPGTVVWIAGGLAKGARFDELIVARRDRLRAVVLIGVDQAPLADALARHAADIPVESIVPDDTGTVMTRAVECARRLARPGDTVLLAPACASMDQFRSYAERGDAFVEAVRAAS